MAWSWSHAVDAYINARAQLETLDRETRNVIAAEWLAAIPHPRHGIGFHADLDMRKYPKSLIRVANWEDERINEWIWERMQDLATCTNGGWEAHCCPFGCLSHMVPFDPVGYEQQTCGADCACHVCGNAFYEGDTTHCHEDEDGSLLWFCSSCLPQPEQE